MITEQDVHDLEKKIAERAQVYMDRPETRPHGFAITVGEEDFLFGRRSGMTSPYAMLEACLEQAAKDLAPGWDHMMARYLDRPPEMRLGLYHGDDR